MSESFVHLASSYYHQAKKQGRLVSWPLAQAEVSRMYTDFKRSYAGDLHTVPCDPLFEKQVISSSGGAACVRAVGKSFPSLSNPYALDKQIEKWTQVRAGDRDKRAALVRHTRALTGRYAAARKRMISRTEELQRQAHTLQQALLREQQAAWKSQDERIAQLTLQAQTGNDRHERQLVREQQLVGKLEAAQRQIEQSEQSLHVKDQRLRDLDAGVERLQRQGAEIEKGRLEANQALVRLCKQLSDAQIEIAKGKNISDSKTKEILDAIQERDRLREQLSDARVEISKSSHISNSKTQEILDATQERDQLRKQLSDAQIELASSTDASNSKTQEILDAIHERDRLREELSDARVELANSNSNRKTQEILDATQDRDRLCKELSGARVELASSASKTQEMQDAIQERDRLREELNELDRDHRMSSARHERDQTTLHKELAQAHTYAEQIAEAYRASQETVEQLSSELSISQDTRQTEALEAQLAGVQQELQVHIARATQHARHLQERLRASEIDRDDLAEALDQQKQQGQTTTQLVQARNNELSALKKELLRLEGEADLARDQLTLATQNHLSSEAQRRAAMEDVTRLTEKVEDQQAQLRAKDQKLQRLGTIFNKFGANKP